MIQSKEKKLILKDKISLKYKQYDFLVSIKVISYFFETRYNIFVNKD